MKIFLILNMVIILIFFDKKIIAQYNLTEKAPIKPGNQWTILYEMGGRGKGSSTVLDSIIIIDSLEYYVIEGKDYYDGTLRSIGYRYCRVDSDGYYIRYKPDVYANKFGRYYKKDTDLNDFWANKVNYIPNEFYYKIIDTSTTQWNGYSTKVKTLEITDSALIYQLQYWSDDFGLLSIADSEFGFADFLIGCIIDGIAYGDTTIVSVEEENYLVKDFKLYQNYPNPFNPNTTISFFIPRQSFITLKIYDILGREIKVLIEEEMQAGNHSIKFNADNLSTGIYICALKTSGYSSIIKMTLLS